ncbi:hypothetical protein KXD40_002300 [Peronospora effusa]|uniref:RRM domain-containing protein n=1 Tax=Peronospora effusa TaxID=542832 RepID=A0A3M6VIR1_9STRA|nr:hypothetical protein DD238_003957 [Peronospora effusa]UIZ27068.1 hypothetical protein KXD40_002300 [Peronospora effusa]
MSDRASPSPRRSRSPSPGVQAEDKTSVRLDTEMQDVHERSRSHSLARSSGIAPLKDVENPGNNLYVANLATRVGQVELEEIFTKFGRVSKCEVIVDPVTRESRYKGVIPIGKGWTEKKLIGVSRSTGSEDEGGACETKAWTRENAWTTLDRDLLAQSMVDAIALPEIVVVIEDDGVVAETAAGSRVAMTIENEAVTMIGTEGMGDTTTAIVAVEAMTVIRAMTDDVVSLDAAKHMMTGTTASALRTPNGLHQKKKGIASTSRFSSTRYSFSCVPSLCLIQLNKSKLVHLSVERTHRQPQMSAYAEATVATPLDQINKRTTQPHDKQLIVF